jgi:hypothetical protein
VDILYSQLGTANDRRRDGELFARGQCGANPCLANNDFLPDKPISQGWEPDIRKRAADSRVCQKMITDGDNLCIRLFKSEPRGECVGQRAAGERLIRFAVM